MYIYVVMGSTGECPNHTVWSVCAYNNKDDAERHTLEAQKRAKEIFDEANKLNYDERWSFLDDAVNDWDQDMNLNYFMEAEYYVLDVPTPVLIKYQGHKTVFDK